MDVAPNGRVDIVWHDRRHWFQRPGEGDCIHTHIACVESRLGDTYYVNSTDGGGTFSRNFRVSDQSQNNDVGYDYRQGVHWNYGPQTVPIGDSQILVGWMDSREGSTDTDNLDTYLARVDLNASGPDPQTRIDQPNAVARSVAMSNLAYFGGNEGLLSGTFATRNATRVVIVNEGDTAGALAAGVLARANLSSVLLSPAGGLPASVKAEVNRMNPGGAFMIGDASKLSEQVRADLAETGIAPDQITRLAGEGDSGTAAAIAGTMDRRSPQERDTQTPAFDAAIIANASGPDAFAAAGLAAARRLPILFVGNDEVPQATFNALEALNINQTLVVGGPSQVSESLRDSSGTGLPPGRRLGARTSTRRPGKWRQSRSGAGCRATSSTRPTAPGRWTQRCSARWSVARRGSCCSLRRRCPPALRARLRPRAWTRSTGSSSSTPAWRGRVRVRIDRDRDRDRRAAATPDPSPRRRVSRRRCGSSVRGCVTGGCRFWCA